MTRYLSFAFAVFLLSASAMAQTNVSGNITQNTTWTKAGSPYILTGNVGVTSTSTLTIEPGVVVQRASGYFYILFNGALQSAGTEQDSIAFVTPDTAEYPVAFLVFKKSNLTNTTLRFASFHFEGPRERVVMQIGNDAGGTQTNTANTGMLRVSRCNLNGDIFQNDGQAQDTLLIDSCQIIHSYFSNTTPNAPPLTVTNSRIYYSSATNYSNGPAPQFFNCQFTNSAVNAYGTSSSTVISRCDLINSSVFSDGFSSYPVEIDSCTFLNSTVSGAGANITNTTFRATDYLRSVDGFSIDSIMIAADRLNIKNCGFSNESAHGIIGIYGGNSGIPASLTILHNSFRNLYTAVVVHNFSGIQLDSNDFYTPIKYDVANTSSMDFSALHDYFQLQGGQTIDDLILDQNDDLNYGLVTYTPYAGSPNTGALPVALIGFSGSKEENVIKLHWERSDDLVVSAFVVQKNTNNGFTDIGTVPVAGAGTSYSFTDATPVSGSNQYRLKIIGSDGSFTYSNIVPVTFSAIVTALRVYPNPASTYLIIEYAAATAGMQLQLTDAGGKVIKTLTAAPGSIQTRMNVNGVAKGIYKLVIKTGSATESRTVLIQ